MTKMGKIVGTAAFAALSVASVAFASYAEFGGYLNPWSTEVHQFGLSAGERYVFKLHAEEHHHASSFQLRLDSWIRWSISSRCAVTPCTSIAAKSATSVECSKFAQKVRRASSDEAPERSIW